MKIKEKEVINKMTEQAQELIDNDIEKEESFQAEELNEDNDLVGLDKIEFPEMNFDLSF